MWEWAILKRRGSRKEAEGIGRQRQVVKEGCKVKGSSAQEGKAEERVCGSGDTFTFHFHALEKEMAIHSTVLAWRIPGTGDFP